MKTFNSEDASLAAIVLLGKLLQELSSKDLLSDSEVASAIGSAIQQLNRMKSSDAAHVLEHYFEGWLKRS